MVRTRQSSDCVENTPKDENRRKEEKGNSEICGWCQKDRDLGENWMGEGIVRCLLSEDKGVQNKPDSEDYTGNREMNRSNDHSGMLIMFGVESIVN